MRISSPPTTGPCYYGIDTPLKSELIASRHSVEEIRALHRRRQPRLPLPRGAAARPWATPPASATAPPASRAATRWRSPSPTTGSSSSVREGPSLGASHAAPPGGRPRHLGPASRAATSSAARSPTPRSPRSELGWEAAVLTSAGPDFEPERDLPGVAGLRAAAAARRRASRTCTTTTASGARSLRPAPTTSTSPSCPTTGATPTCCSSARWRARWRGGMATAFEAEVVGAAAQGWLRALRRGRRRSAARSGPARRADLAGVHVLFLSEQDLPEAASRGPGLPRHRAHRRPDPGLGGLTLLTRDGVHDVPDAARARRSTPPAPATSSPPLSWCATMRPRTSWRPRRSRPAPPPARSRPWAPRASAIGAEVEKRMALSASVSSKRGSGMNRHRVGARRSAIALRSSGPHGLRNGRRSGRGVETAQGSLRHPPAARAGAPPRPALPEGREGRAASTARRSTGSSRAASSRVATRSRRTRSRRHATARAASAS